MGWLLWFQSLIYILYTMWRCYNMVNCLQNPHNRNPMVRLCGWGMGYLLRVQTQTYVLSQSLQCSMKYHVVLKFVTAALDCYCLHVACEYHAILDHVIIAVKFPWIFPEMPGLLDSYALWRYLAVMPQSYYHVLAATSRNVVRRGYDVAAT